MELFITRDVVWAAAWVWAQLHELSLTEPETIIWQRCRRV